MKYLAIFHLNNPIIMQVMCKVLFYTYTILNKRNYI